MSSHHIVRENQEPALLIMHAHAISFEKIQELLEWMPTVVVLHTEVDTVIGWGIKVDVVIAPLAEIENWREKLVEQTPVKIVSFNLHDDPLATAFYFLNAAKASGVNVLLGNKSELNKIESLSNLAAEAFVDHIRWSLIRSGCVEKWFPAGANLFIYPNEMRNNFAQFVSGKMNVQQDGIVTLQNDPSFWLGEELGE
jgi:hypothetical protein